MLRSARKKSEDPVQESLREKKSVWNKQVSILIENLIQFKKMMNGYPSKFYMEKTRIINPLPQTASTILLKLTEEFHSIATLGHDISKQQEDYSKTRRKKQVNACIKNISSENTKLASNKLTRFLTKFKGPFFGPEKEYKKHRLSMLQLAAELDKICSNFELSILGSTKESIEVAFKLLSDIENKIIQLSGLLKLISSNAPQNKIENIEKPNYSEITSIIEDFKNNIYKFPKIKNSTTATKLLLNISKFDSSQNDFQKAQLAKQILSLYNLIKEEISMYLNVKGNSLEEISNKLLNNKENELNKTAANYLNKLIRKQKHSLFSDKSSSARLISFSLMKDLRKELDQFMNELESGFNYDNLNDHMNNISGILFEIKKSTNLLIPESDAYKSELFNVNKNLQKIIDLKKRDEMYKQFYNK